MLYGVCFFFSSRRRHTRCSRDWSSDVCSSDLTSTYPVSTSMFGLGDARGRMTTPLGYMAVEKKIGDNVPVGAVFHNRRITGEILQPNAPGRDPITTRIIWLRGLEAQNAHAYQRCIYIHGTP